jgi:hypothetical protein
MASQRWMIFVHTLFFIQGTKMRENIVQNRYRYQDTRKALNLPNRFTGSATKRTGNITHTYKA